MVQRFALSAAALLLLSACEAVPYLVAGAAEGMANAGKATQPSYSAHAPDTQRNRTCHLSSESTSGLDTACTYDCGGSSVTITSLKLCKPRISM